MAEPNERPNVEPFDLGTTLNDRYRIEEKLGQGGMGTVYRGVHLFMERSVAIKVLHPHLITNNDFIQRFLHEARVNCKIAHRNAVTLYDFGVEGQTPYLVFEFVEGMTLREVLTKEGRFSSERFTNIITQVGAALAHAHSLQIVHRDLKPDNIMLAHRGGMLQEYACVLDFGIAKALHHPAGEFRTVVTQMGMVMGTPQYLSPEQALEKELDCRSDIYSLGIIMYEMLTGEVPFNSPSSPLEILVQHLNVEPTPIRILKPELNVPADIAAAVMRCLNKNPADRFQNVDELLAAILKGSAAAKKAREDSTEVHNGTEAVLKAETSGAEKRRTAGIALAAVAAVAIAAAGYAAHNAGLLSPGTPKSDNRTETRPSEAPKSAAVVEEKPIEAPPPAIAEADRRTEQARAEEQRLEQQREEQARAEAARAEEKARTEQAKAEQEKAELAKVEQAKAEQERAEAARAEAARAEERAKAEREKAELAKAEQAKVEQAKAEQAQAEQARAEAARLEQERAEQARLEAERAELERAEKARAEQARLELQARIAQPPVEAPPAEVPPASGDTTLAGEVAAVAGADIPITATSKEVPSQQFESRLAAAKRLLQRKEYLAAAKEYVPLLRTRGENMNARLSFGTCLLKLGAYDAAKREFDRVLQIEPQFAPALYMVAAYHAVKRESEPALDNLSRALKLFPGAKKWIAEDDEFASLKDDPAFQKLLSAK